MCLPSSCPPSSRPPSLHPSPGLPLLCLHANGRCIAINGQCSWPMPMADTMPSMASAGLKTPVANANGKRCAISGECCATSDQC
eukprot:scaffold299404_cov18-Tisochrysis_lutea.AAC.1